MEDKTVLSGAVKRVLDENVGIILAFNDEGTLIYMNRMGEEELGYTVGETDIRDIFSHLVSGEEALSSLVKEMSGKNISTVVYRKNNTCFSAAVRMLRLEEPESCNILSVINTQYETYARQELAKVENTMKDATRARNEFVANITHELRTPLNGIKGHIRDLQGREEQNDKKRTLNVILKCCENMEKIINNLLDFSKIEAGKFEIVEAPFSFRESIKHVVDTSVSIANEKGLKLLAYVAPDIPDTIVGDELRIVQILNNLVSNALKFTAIGYVNIEVYKTRLKDGRMELTFFVIDTGVGVSVEEKEKLFKSFSQADGSVTRKYGGTGLGLFVTKQLVELMHGAISVESEKGKGSTFTFTIEVGVENENAEMEQAPPVITHIMKTDEMGISYMENMDQVYIYGTPENSRELKSNFEKLLLCVEMGNWEKAEHFSDNVKQLAKGGEKELKNSILKLQMAVRKEDYEKSVAQMNLLKEKMGF